MPGIIFANPDAGPGDGLAALRNALAGFDGLEVRECPPDGLVDQIRAALERGVSFVGVCGGDGTVGTAAGELAGTDVPLLVIPGGTRNHFARALGLPDLDHVVDAITNGVDRWIDLGDVDGTRFVNNVSIGLYPRLVRRREHYERRMSKRAGHLLAAWDQVRRGRRFDVEIEGAHTRTWAVFVGNGCYGETLVDLVDRTSLDDGVLDLRIVHADRRLARVRVVLALLVGRLDRSPLVERRTTDRIRIAVRHRRLDVAVDGEVRTLDGALTVRTRPGALLVRVPDPARTTRR